MKPYEEIDFPNGFLRWIREDGVYGCTLTEEQMIKIKALHEAPRPWVGLTDEELPPLVGDNGKYMELQQVRRFYKYIEAKLKEKNT